MKRINSKCCWYLATLSLWFNSQEPSLWKAPRVHPRNMLTAQLQTAVGWKSSRGVLERVLLLAGVLLILKFMCRGKIVCNCKVRKYTTVSLSSCCAIELLWQFISSTACRCLSYRPEGVWGAEPCRYFWGQFMVQKANGRYRTLGFAVHTTVNVWNTNLAWKQCYFLVFFTKEIYKKDFIFLNTLCDKCLFLSSYRGCSTFQKFQT